MTNMHGSDEDPQRRSTDHAGEGPSRWRFSRTLSLDSLLAVGAATLAVIFFGTTLDKRLSLLEKGYEDLVKVIERNETAQKERSLRIEETVKDQGRLLQQALTAQGRR